MWVFVVDASSLVSSIPATVQDLILHTTNQITLSDSVTVANTFVLNAPSVTLLGDVTLSGTVQDWTYANAPILRYFTNNGVLTIPNGAHFGDDGPTNYLAFVNNGSISAGGQTIDSYYFENNGTLNAGDGCYVTTASGRFQNGRIISGSEIQLYANNLKFNQSSLKVSGGELDFIVTNSLADLGGGSSNSFTCDSGFNLWIKPGLGDLLGTTMTTVAPNVPRVWVYHDWAGANYGAVNSGYTNNVALGQLVLSPKGSVVSFPPTFYFLGATGGGVTNGLYVDLLDLSALGTDGTPSRIPCCKLTRAW